MDRRLVDRWNNKARASALAAQKRHAHFERRDREAAMAPKKPKFVGVVPLVNPVGHPEEGETIGTGTLESLGGKVIVHVDGNTITGETLRRGFSFGSFTIVEEEEEPTT